MVKKLSYVSVLVLLLAVILLLAPTCQCSRGTQQAAVPPGPPQVTSFKIANENVAPGDVPLFTWQATNASAVTITQDGEDVFHIESVPDSGAGAFLTPLHDRAYASSTSEYEVKQPYIPGVFPSNFVGAATGKPSHAVWKFGENKTEPGSAEIKALSDVGLVTDRKVTFFNFVAEGQGSASPQITAPPCVNHGSSEPLIPVIEDWTVKNSELEDGIAPEFEFKVTNPAIISIKQGGEFISFVQINNPPLVTSGISLPSLSGEAYASSTGEYEVKRPYSPGVYPVIYQGSSSGRPATIAWKFGEKFREITAEITVCSPTGDMATATVKFTIMRVKEQTQEAQPPAAACQSPVISFNASRVVVAAMDPVNFDWNVTGDNLTVRLVSNGVQRTVPPSGSEGMIIMKSACYYIIAENPCGRASESQCITVQSAGFIPPPVYVEPPCPPPPAPPTMPPPVAPRTPITDGY
jgi:hypothetical protein